MASGYEPQLGDFWRGIVLVGRNVASYKFALAKALLEMQPRAGSLIKLEDLALPFASHICGHLKSSDTQGSFKRSKFLDACRGFNEGRLDETALVDATVRNGFVNVIDAFHVVGPGPVAVQFYVDERKVNNGIRITDEFSELLSDVHATDLDLEAEARWRLVETAWNLKVPRALLRIDYDESTQQLLAIEGGFRRTSVTSSRNALNGYQKGYCFYCYRDVHVDGTGEMAEVDHFFPHALKQLKLGLGVDGVWNLVLSCRHCNRGVAGKMARVPSMRLLERLHVRNEHIISSHHPLRETLMTQTGGQPSARLDFLKSFHTRAHQALLHTWEPREEMKASVPFSGPLV